MLGQENKHSNCYHNEITQRHFLVVYVCFTNCVWDRLPSDKTDTTNNERSLSKWLKVKSCEFGLSLLRTMFVLGLGIWFLVGSQVKCFN